MSESFDDAYSEAYDLLYHDKDYEREAAFVAALVERFCPGVAGTGKWLDLACGTGRHAIEWAKLGYDVAGSDPSGGMLSMARKRAESAGYTIEWFPCSFQEAATISRRFDVVSAMFSAVNYLTTYDDLAQGLSSVHGLLREGGVFVFDVWNGTAVLDHHSPTRVRDVEEGRRHVHRVSTTSLDRLRHLATVHYDVLLTDGDRVTARFSEDHCLRYYFPQELRDALDAHGFEFVFWCPFLEPDRELDPLDWNITLVARRT